MPAVGDDELDEVGEYLVSTLENRSKQLCHSVWLYFPDILSHGHQAVTVAFIRRRLFTIFCASLKLLYIVRMRN